MKNVTLKKDFVCNVPNVPNHMIHKQKLYVLIPEKATPFVLVEKTKRFNFFKRK